MIRSATIIGGVVSRGGAWLFRQHPVRLVTTIAATVAILIVQLFMVRLSYIGGSIIATPFDHVRMTELNNAYGASPMSFANPEFLSRFLKVDWISAPYVFFSVAVIAFAYRAGNKPTTLWLCLSTPYWLMLFGSLSVAAITLSVNLIIIAPLNLLARTPVDWSLTKEYVLSIPYLTVDLVAGIYCSMACVAVLGARAVRRLWAVNANSPGERS